MPKSKPNPAPYREKYTNEMDFREFCDWAKGHVLVAIGRGEYGSALTTVIQAAYENGANIARAGGGPGLHMPGKKKGA